MRNQLHFLLLISCIILGNQNTNAQQQDNSNIKSKVKFDVDTNAVWINPFPKGKLNKAYDIQSENDHKDASKLFEVKSNSIKALYKWPNGAAPFGIISTIKKYSYYNLEFSYKWGKRKFDPRAAKKRDAGVLFHMHGKKMVWPSSLECQVQEGDAGDLWVVKGPKVTVIHQNGSKQDIDTGIGEEEYLRSFRYQNFEKKGWNHIRVEIRGNTSARFFVNGHLVNELMNFTTKTGEPLSEGYISFQAEGAEVTYKKIRLQNLSK